MYDVSAQGVDERMINVRYYYLLLLLLLLLFLIIIIIIMTEFDRPEVTLCG